MSIAWTRIIPSGLPGSPVNAAGVAFYKNVITELLKAGIVPAVTMFHCGWPGGGGGRLVASRRPLALNSCPAPRSRRRPRPPRGAPLTSPRRPFARPTTPGDLPQGVQDKLGGFLADGTAFQDAFVYYADTLFKELGPLVKLWMT
jgi:hypothetical protein